MRGAYVRYYWGPIIQVAETSTKFESTILLYMRFNCMQTNMHPKWPKHFSKTNLFLIMNSSSFFPQVICFAMFMSQWRKKHTLIHAWLIFWASIVYIFMSIPNRLESFLWWILSWTCKVGENHIVIKCQHFDLQAYSLKNWPQSQKALESLAFWFYWLKVSRITRQLLRKMLPPQSYYVLLCVNFATNNCHVVVEGDSIHPSVE